MKMSIDVDKRKAKLNAMKQSAEKFSSREKWYQKASEFLAGLEMRLAEILEENFCSAVNYYFDYLLPKAMAT
jgi:hypothetical protein